MCLRLEKNYFPKESSTKKEDVQFRQNIALYDEYEARLDKIIPFEKRVEQMHDYFVTKGAQLEKFIQKM